MKPATTEKIHREIIETHTSEEQEAEYTSELNKPCDYLSETLTKI